MRGRAALLLAALVVGCTGSSTEVETQAPTVQVDAAALEKSWPIGYAKVESFEAYQTPGWLTLLQKRDYRTAASELAGTKGAARPHAEAAALFRQAALVSANAAIETYAKTPEATDPVGAAHLLAIAYALNGDLEKARAASARLDGVEDVTSTWHAPWKAWLAGDATWPPDLSALPLELPPVEPGKWPLVTDVPHYAMPVQVEGDYKQAMGDPGSLVALALWHEQLAKKIAGDDKAVDLSIARYRFPVEPEADPSGTLSMDFLYGSDFLVPADAQFMADVVGGKGAAAVAAHESTSLMASLAAASRVDGKINAEKAVDQASAVRKAIIETSSSITKNEVQRHHRLFADIAYIGILRNLALVAEEEGDNREEGGKLRILAMEGSLDHTGCAVGLMSLAAWDTGNRYPSRAQEIIHRNTVYYPSLEAARYGLDVLALRVSRERVETPGM